MCHFDAVSLRYSYAVDKKKPENNLHMPKIEKTVKRNCSTEQFLRFILQKWLATRLASDGEARILDFSYQIYTWHDNCLMYSVSC